MAKALGRWSSTAVLRDALANPSIRRLEISWTAGTAADWAFLVLMLVVAYDAAGALGVGILGAVRVLPAIVAAPFAPVLVERFGGSRVLTVVNLARCLGALLTALVIAMELPLAWTFVLVAFVAGAGALVRPIQTALLPAFARSPGELVAANVASSLGEGLGTFLGPLLASIVVATTGSAATALLVAAAFGGAAAVVTGIRFERAADARPGAGEDGASGFRVAEAARLLKRYPTTTLLMSTFVAQVFVRGLLITLIVVASIGFLGMGETGVGLLNAAIGLGGLVGAFGALGLAGGRRLPAVVAIALTTWGLPLVLIGAWPEAAIALVALFVTGVSNSVLDVSGFTLIQRGVRTEDRVLVFGLFEGALGVGLFAGSIVAPGLVALAGGRLSFVLAGALLPVLALATYRRVERGTVQNPEAEARLALLRRNPLFAPLPLTALDQLAETMTPVRYAEGEALMRKGESGDEYVLIAVGEVLVSDDGALLATCGPGDGVGEIALLHRVRRTATVVAGTTVDGYSIESSDFLDAVAGFDASTVAERIATARLERSQMPTSA